MSFIQCAYFWTPLDQEFFDVRKASVMFDLSWFGAGQNVDDGCVPSRGVAALEGFNGRCGLPFGGGVALRPFFPSRFDDMEDDSGALPVRWLGGGRWTVAQGFRYGELPRCHAYSPNPPHTNPIKYTLHGSNI